MQKWCWVVEERSVCAEVHRVSGDGAYRSENVGMSSKNEGENPSHRKPKVSWATQIDPGLADPKACPDQFGGSRWTSRLIFLRFLGI
jgi:hypothetical protein